MKNKISIILAIYNMEKYIEECLNSIVNQSYKNLEIIVINDGSTDKSLSLLESFSKKDSRIKIINQKNIGVSGARNNGIDNFTGEYIMFVDADDYLLPNYVKEMYDTLKKYDLDIVKSSYGKFKETPEKYEKISYFKEDFLYIDNSKINNLFISTPNFNSSCMQLIKKDLLKDLRFDRNLGYAEDFLFTFTLFKRAKNIGYINNNGYLCRENASSASRSKKIDKQIRNCLDCINAYKILLDSENQNSVFTKIIKHIVYLLFSIDVRTLSKKEFLKKMTIFYKSSEWKMIDKKNVDFSQLTIKLRPCAYLIIRENSRLLYLLIRLYQFLNRT